MSTCRRGGSICATEAVPAAPTIVANLLRPLLLALRFADEPPGALIASGLLEDEGDEVAAALERHGLRETARRTTDGWLAVVFS